jgi:RNA-directed DNA polymerase
MEGRGDRVMAPISLQDLRRGLYIMAKADKTKRFCDLYDSVGDLETLRTGYDLAKRNCHGRWGQN